MDVKVALLTGSTKKKERDKILPAIASGEIQIVIGTHALIEETVVFSSLGLAIIDEQHRFWCGATLTPLDEERYRAAVLVMTATPIPRTLAMTLYGDLDVSVIDELPPGRKPIQRFIAMIIKRRNCMSSFGKRYKRGVRFMWYIR